MFQIFAKATVAAILFTQIYAGAAVRTYQVTGPIVEVTKDSIVLLKGKEKWEIAKDAATKVTGNLKVGNKVTIEYRMAAATAEAKEAKKRK